MHYCYLFVLLLATILRPASPIANGRTDNHFHYHAIVFCFNNFIRNYCGGTVISPKYVVTAGSCKLKNTVCTVSAGGLKTSSADAEDRVGVLAFHVHPLYLSDRKNIAYDIALITLERNLRDTTLIKIVNFKRDKLLPLPGEDAVMVGNGRDAYDAFQLNRQVVLTKAPLDICPSRDEPIVPFEPWPTMYCIVFPNGGTAKYGDAGNGLVDRSELLIGVLSFNANKTYDGKPLVNKFVMMTLVNDWIYDTMHQNCSVKCAEE